MPASYLFVYGTLRSDYSGASPVKGVLNRFAERVGPATLQGRLYNIDWYPGVILSDHPEDVVVGELYSITNETQLLLRLDEYEGCSPEYPEPKLYVRKKVPVQTKKGERVLAWVYLYNGDADENERIKSGDFIKG